ncbi:MaoC family dehydratase [Catenuloplanes sp. NPDC051500]|uniref:MaoC family dehydratase n=1 Tax=Catenuloplanes sp. NPDC051500 TaxID=3363959 RepID=UPI0037A245DA
MELPVQRYRVTRADLIRYAGASGDFNPIHWSESTAAKVGLPGVIAHGMLTMALVGRAVTTWAGRPDAVVEYGVRFTRPVEVPDTGEGTEIEVSAVAKDTDDPSLVRLDLTATCQGVKVLAQAKAVIKRP